VRQDALDAFDEAAETAGVPYQVVGRAGGDEVSLSGQGGLLAAVQLDALRQAHEGWMPRFMGEAVEA
jgi:phosphoribosylformylglycinamidine synthase